MRGVDQSCAHGAEFWSARNDQFLYMRRSSIRHSPVSMPGRQSGEPVMGTEEAAYRLIRQILADRCMSCATSGSGGPCPTRQCGSARPAGARTRAHSSPTTPTRLSSPTSQDQVPTGCGQRTLPQNGGFRGVGTTTICGRPHHVQRVRSGQPRTSAKGAILPGVLTCVRSLPRTRSASGWSMSSRMATAPPGVTGLVWAARCGVGVAQPAQGLRFVEAGAEVLE